MNKSVDIDVKLLLTELKAGSLPAFNQIYLFYSPALYAHLLKFLKSPELVEEVLQEVFVKIWNLRAEIEPDRGFKTFLYRISSNLAINVIKKINRDKALQAEVWASSISYYFHSEEKLLDKERLEIIDRAIATLTPKRREILHFCKVEGRSYKEVADLLGISVSTVSNQLVNAIHDIRCFIVKNYSEEYLVGVFLLLAIQF
ncbi:RNA polymerase sigma factor [Sphingobacterium hotanense]|uniref:RNA polymerase sigma factor n=1 Tax=Sphingobacterium hotanense TaxID=649196 RepID=UPI0021A3E7A1|nr:sigma-70 family RNA polymerase sigma factor [Sphingobacterium hotanense]MCT1526709.1 sigma-70 family RNA polymerase sigma factor [Sphingobacterium hotanense]